MLKTGMILGERYEIVSKIGTGGMADVYKAKDHKLNRFVAAKILKPEFREDTTFIRKFRSEAQAAAGLTHPNIVNVFDVGEDDGMHYIVMELIEGITLKEYINKKGKLSIKEATSIAIQVSMGLEAAHSHGIVHRDVKPQNIMISTDGKVKVTDFGIARAASSNTISSNVMGSVHYSSPEQVRGGYSDEKSDIYSLGITLYEMVTGRVPFEGDTTVAIAIKHLQEEMVPPSVYAPELPYSLEQIIHKCTQKSVDRRYQRMDEVIADLKRSLIDPEGDFVKQVPVDEGAKTLVISDNDLTTIKSSSGKVNVNKAQKPTIHVQEDAKELEKEVTENDYYDDDDYPIKREKRDTGKKKKKHKSRKLQITVTLAGLAVGIVVLAGAIWFIGNKAGLFGEGNPSQQTNNQQNAQNEDDDNALVEVPRLVGMTEEAAAAEAQGRHLGVKFAGEEASSQEKGQISSQEPAAGSMVQKYSTITYKISQGLKEIQMEELSGQIYNDELVQSFLDQGITVKVQRQYDDYEAEDVILSATPAQGETVKSGDTVTIVVSDNDALYQELPEEVFEPETAQSSENTAVQPTAAPDTADASNDTASASDETTASTGSGNWVCNQKLNTPEGYLGGPLRLELVQEVNGEIEATMIVDGEVLEFPYQLNIVGKSGVSSGELHVSEIINGEPKKLGHYPLTFQEQ